MNILCRRAGFTLFELAIALLLISLTTSFVLTTTRTAEATKDCYTETRQKVNEIRGAVEAFARSKNRLPMPAARNLTTQDISFGREDDGTNVTTHGGLVSIGALPFQALGLSADYAGDCWGNKFTYVVTKDLTASGALNDATKLPAISLKKDAATAINNSIAYAIVSHGENGFGASKLNQTDASWCAGTTLEAVNCSAASAEVVDAMFNDGKNAGDNYFDDVVSVGGKPPILASAPPADCTFKLGGVDTPLAHATTFSKFSTWKTTWLGAMCDGGLRCSICVGQKQTASCNDGTTTYTPNVTDPAGTGISYTFDCTPSCVTC